MRILSIHITGFGKFVNRAFDLSAPIVVCKQENGWGKTTIADFIECMLYGMDNGRKSSVSQNLRAKYEPWSGARYGGALVIEENGKTYRIERTFGKTPSSDTVRIFDGNNMACYDFGDRAQTLGEVLFGVDKESYRRTAYIPQGEVQTDALTGDVKSKLLSILSATPSDGTSQKAMDRLDNAERALRAKRRPGKGKLDEIDEQLAYVETQKADCIRASQALRTQRERLDAYTQKMQYYTAELSKISALLEEYTRRGEMVANRAVRREMETTYQNANEALKELSHFFGVVDPTTLNTEGLENAVIEFYALKNEIETMESKLASLSAQDKERELLQTQLSACEKTIESYEMLAQTQAKKDEREKKKQRFDARYAKKRRKRGMFVLCLSLAMAILGAFFSETTQTLGVIMLIVGTLGTLYGFGTIYRHTKGLPSRKKRRLIFDDPEIEARYKATLAEADELMEKLSNYEKNSGGDYATTLAEIESKKARAVALETAITGFISNFRFEAVYDYRSALSRIKESVADYIRFSEATNTYAQKISALTPVAETGIIADYSQADVEELSRRRIAMEGERERLRGEYARLYAEAERLETQAFRIKEYEAERLRLQEEKQRLERRLLAIRSAKELLSRARANMATRYLDPVESRCRRYAEIVGFTLPAKFRFNGEGLPMLEESGALHATDYYSLGLRELLDFCVRIALAETLYVNVRPPLILDDPFANLDDDKTLRAKSLVQELSKKYQILYFTCKQERTL